MKRSDDLTALLLSWEYNEKRPVRRVRAADGREVLQVRLPLGIEQYDIDGRPDGKRPEGCDSWLRFYQKKAQAMGPEFVLTPEDCERLQSEGILYYYRYLIFFEIGEYALCERDTARNLRLLEFVSSHSSRRKCVESLEQYRPYILRVNIVARTLRLLKQRGDLRAAIRRIEKGMDAIRNLPPLGENVIFSFEKDRSLKSMGELLRQFRSQVPVPKRVLLQKQMREAIAREDYEQAAALRDEIRTLRRTAPHASSPGEGSGGP